MVSTLAECSACGNPVSVAASSCPRCGHPIRRATGSADLVELSGPDGATAGGGLGLFGLTCGILAIGVAFVPSEASWFAIVLSLLAIIFSTVALNRIREGHSHGRGIAIAGLLAGGVGLLLFLFALVVLYSMFGEEL